MTIESATLFTGGARATYLRGETAYP